MAGTRPDRDTELGQLAYRAHYRALGDTQGVPGWNDLPPRVQTAWEIVAAVVKRSVQREGR